MGWVKEIGDLFEKPMTSSKPPSWWNLAALWIMPLLLFWSIYTWNADSAISKRQCEAQGTITTHDVHNHGRYGYTFSINGKTYRGWVYPGTHLDFQIGELVNVYYDPLNPSVNANDTFADQAIGSLYYVLFIIVITTGVIIALYLQRRNVLSKNDRTL
jgi:hypothetical protein